MVQILEERVSNHIWISLGKCRVKWKDFIGEDGEIDYDLYESAVEDFHNNLWEMKERLKEGAISISKLVETEN